MPKRMKLKGRVQTKDSILTFSSTHHDGTPFSIPVDEFDVELNEQLTFQKPVVDGWLFVSQEAKQDTRCYLTLPKSSIQFGKQLVVHELQLMPVSGKIEDFNPKVSGSGVQTAT